MSITSAAFDQFEDHVFTDKGMREVQCGNFLEFAADMLFTEANEDQRCTREDRSFYGSSDFIATAVISDGRGEKRRHARIWEIKAPQCYIMEKDGNNQRFRPTIDFIKAENQLIHYGNELQNSDAFRVRCGAMRFDDIRLGGIIIGRAKDRFVKDPADVAKAKRSLEIRERYLYGIMGIRVLTWDAIVERLRP